MEIFFESRLYTYTPPHVQSIFIAIVILYPMMILYDMYPNNNNHYYYLVIVQWRKGN